MFASFVEFLSHYLILQSRSAAEEKLSRFDVSDALRLFVHFL